MSNTQSVPQTKTVPNQHGGNTFIDKSVTNIAVHVESLTIENHYHVVTSGKIGKLEMEEHMKMVGDHTCLSHLCTCEKCMNVKTSSPLLTSSTRINHSANKFINCLLKHVKLLDDMPVMKGAEKHTLYGGQEVLSVKIKEFVDDMERNKNLEILHALGITEARDAFQRIRQLENSLVGLVQQMESYQRMGDACAYVFKRKTPSHQSSRRLVTDADLKTLCIT